MRLAIIVFLIVVLPIKNVYPQDTKLTVRGGINIGNVDSTPEAGTIRWTGNDFEGWNGAYVWIEGFRISTHVFNLLYFANKAWVNLGGTYGRTSRLQPVIHSLNNTSDTWHKVQLNIQSDFEKN